MAFVEKLIADYCPSPTLIYEPFAGTGTTLFAADVMGCGTVWSEVNPLLQFLIHTKLKAMSLNHEERQLLAVKLLDLSASVLTHCSDYDRSEALAESYESTFGKSEYFPREEYDRILRLRSYIDDVARHDQLLADLLTVGVVACLLPVSYMKKQGDVRFKTEKERQNMMALSDVLPLKLKEMASDLTAFDFYTYHSHRLITANAKHIGTAPEVRISDVITSPPYLNGTNYFRNTKLEIWFMGILKNKAMLRTLRNEALTSGINDVLLIPRYALMPRIDLFLSVSSLSSPFSIITFLNSPSRLLMSETFLTLNHFSSAAFTSMSVLTIGSGHVSSRRFAPVIFTSLTSSSAL